MKILRRGLKWFPDGAETKDMRPRTRLDPVIKIEEKNEERKLREMAAANRKVKSAEEALVGARDAARTDHRRAASATDWMLAENAHTRALSEVRKAEREVKVATDEEGKARGAYTIAHSKAEALRRVAQARVDEIRGRSREGRVQGARRDRPHHVQRQRRPAALLTSGSGRERWSAT